MDFYLASGHLLRDLDFLDGPWQVEVPLKMTAETYNFGHDFVIRLLFFDGQFSGRMGRLCTMTDDVLRRRRGKQFIYTGP